MLFIGGLGLAVLAGPANCPCSSAFAVAEQSSLARLGYVQNARMMVEREMAQPDAELPALSTAALIEPEESAIGVSPITTSALEPSREATAIASEVLPAPSAPRLPANIEQLADAGPENVKLAAASDVTTDVPPTLPTIEVAIPPTDSVEPRRPRARKSVAKTRRAKKRTAMRAYRTPQRSHACAPRSAGEPIPAKQRRSGRSRCSSLRGRAAPSPTPSKRHRRATRASHVRAMRRDLTLILVALVQLAAPTVAIAAPGYAWQFSAGEQTLEQRFPATARLRAHGRRAGQLGGVAARAADEAGEVAGPDLHRRPEVAAGRACRR